jgi:hypothetical protein
MSGCGKSSNDTPKPLPPTYGVDAQFNTLVEDFYAQANTRGVSLPRNLVVTSKEVLSDGSLPANTIGVCYYPYSQRQYPYVEIKKAFWDSANDEARRNLIFHELGHCLLYRAHENATQFAPTIGRSIPLSIMYPYILMTMSTDVTNFYLNHITDYINELFDTTQLATIQGYATNAARDGFDPNYIPDLGGFSATLDNGDCIHKE